ncbi:MAG: hypothetical protein QOF07_190 [Bradyrhizobium sp.]|jgi:hypothetical protein|nr:hypothetical protein [Bradyrhizobium sp.]
MAIFFRHRVQHQKPAATAPGFLLGPRHQRRADAVTARGAMHQELLDIGAVRLVGRRIQPELDRADDFAAELGRQQHGIISGDRDCDLAEERQRVGLRERRHEADAGAALDAIDQHRGELIQRACSDRRHESDDLRRSAHAARSSFDATVASAFSR